ncbi:MAG: thioredoxin domain-containing protein [Patescibacteria group bacterium]
MMNPFQQPESKTQFWFGAIAGVMALCTIGFVVLLVIMLRGGSFGSLAKEAKKVAPTDTTTPPVASAEIRDVSKADHLRGDIDADIILVEYSDMECPFCKQFHETVKQVVADNGDKVAWVYRHFPLDSLHQKARGEAIATECAADQGGNDAFWKFLDEVFTQTNSNDSLPETALPEIAEKIGLNRAKFESCLKSGDNADVVQADYDDAIAAGGTGTPFTVVVSKDEKIPVNGAVPLSQLQGIIDSLSN